MYEYKVLIERDKRLSGGFDADTLVATINSYAGEGWRLTETMPVPNMLKSFKAEPVDPRTCVARHLTCQDGA